MSDSLPKKVTYSRAPFMSLDLRGRMVANKRAVFAASGIRAEIQAARTLAKALTTVRERKLSGD